MTKLPVISAKKCITALENIGFYVARQEGSHITLRRDEPSSRVTVPNHKTLKKGMLRRIIRDAELTVEEFAELL